MDAAVAHVPFVHEGGIGQSLRVRHMPGTSHVVIDNISQPLVTDLHVRVIEFARHNAFAEHVLSGAELAARSFHAAVPVVRVKIRVVHVIFPAAVFGAESFAVVCGSVFVYRVNGVHDQCVPGRLHQIHFAPFAAVTSEIRHFSGIRHQPVLLGNLAAPASAVGHAFDVIGVLRRVKILRRAVRASHVVDAAALMPVLCAAVDAGFGVLNVPALTDFRHDRFGGFLVFLGKHFFHFGAALVHGGVQTVVGTELNLALLESGVFAFAVEIGKILGKLLPDVCKGVVFQPVEGDIGKRASYAAHRTVIVGVRVVVEM